VNKEFVASFVLLAVHVAAASVRGTLVEAEAFADRGGWTVDQQS